MSKTDFSILLVEDEEHMITSIRLTIEGQYELAVAQSIAEAKRQFSVRAPDLLLLDLGLPDGSGIDYLRELRQKLPDLQVVVLTGSQEVGTAVEVMKLGAQDYLQKPFAHEDLLLCIQRAFEKWELSLEVFRLRSELYEPFRWDKIIGCSPALEKVLKIAKRVSRSDTTVLLTGESGTGKELIAKAIHCEGVRVRGPFVAINCAQFSDTLLESELFGHEKGAFTGAAGQRRGRFELADNGTLFLDEIGNTSLDMQAKVLRAVETKQFERVGGEKSLSSDFRLIAATNTNLEAAVERGAFRKDLYYRLNVVRIEMPPLRDRRTDIPLLCDHFLRRLCAKTGEVARPITPEAMAILSAWPWPGNVRELQNVLEMAHVLEEGDCITSRSFPVQMRAAAQAGRKVETPASGNLLEAMLHDYERLVIEEHLRANGWNQLKTARSLGTHRNTIDKKVKLYGLSRPKAQKS